jgi:hypothetical protein
MDDQAYVDISKFSFDEFMAFQFDREAPPDTEKRDPWYWHTEVTFDPEQVCIHYVRLFREPNFLLQRFSTKQLEQGFWGIQSRLCRCGDHRDGGSAVFAEGKLRPFDVSPVRTSVCNRASGNLCSYVVGFTLL